MKARGMKLLKCDEGQSENKITKAFEFMIK